MCAVRVVVAAAPHSNMSADLWRVRARDCVRAKKDDAIVESTNSPISPPGISDNVIAARSRSDHLRAHFHAGNSRFSRSKQSPARCTSIGEQTGSTRSFARPAVLCCIHKSSSARPENIQNGRRRRRVYLRLRRESEKAAEKKHVGKIAHRGAGKC